MRIIKQKDPNKVNIKYGKFKTPFNLSGKKMESRAKLDRYKRPDNKRGLSR